MYLQQACDGILSCSMQVALLRAASLLFIAYALFDLWRPDALLVGNVTVDQFPGGWKRLSDSPESKVKSAAGGAVTYAAAVAQGLGRHACVVTTASHPQHAAVVDGQALHVVHSSRTLTFEHTYTWFGNARQLRVTAVPNVTLSAHHVPWSCWFARNVILGPLVQSDIDIDSFLRPRPAWRRVLLRFQHVGVMAQGLQRGVRADGRVYHLKAPSDALQAALGPAVSLFLSDVETDPWSQEDFQRITASVGALVVTRGEKGVSVHRAGSAPLHIPAWPIKAVDTNGAGDTFATSYVIARSDGHDVRLAGRMATWAASRVCLQPQTCKPACAADAVQAQYEDEELPKVVKHMPEVFQAQTVLPPGNESAFTAQ